MGFFSAKSTTYDPLSAYTPEQLASVQALMSLASTGSGGGLTLGQQYGGDLGYYTQTAGEQQALQGLQGLVSGGDISGARDVYSRMASNKFNPDDPSSGYAAFSRALAKAGAESSDALNREAAITGSRFGTAIAGEKANLAADLANQRGMFLADLYNQGENRALQGATGLQSLVGTQQDLFQQLASQSAVERLLKDQQAKDQYQEFNRSRNEELSRIGLMQNQMNNPMGKIETKSPSTFSKIAAPIGTALGALLAAPTGGMSILAGSSLGGILGGGVGVASDSTNTVSSGGGLNLSSLLSLFGNSGTVGNTGKTQSEILGFDTRQYRSR